MSAAERVAAAAKAAARQGVAYRVGVVVDVAGQLAHVDLGDRLMPAFVPAGMALAEGVAVRLAQKRGENTSTVAEVLQGAVPGSFWTGKQASARTLTASRYMSVDLSTVVRSSGDLAPVWDGHRFTVPPAVYELSLSAQFDNSSTTGNRLAGFLLNPTANTYNSADAPVSGVRLKWEKLPGGSDFVTVTCTVPAIRLAGTDAVMPLVRSTAGQSLESAAYETSLTVKLLRS